MKKLYSDLYKHYDITAQWKITVFPEAEEELPEIMKEFQNDVHRIMEMIMKDKWKGKIYCYHEADHSKEAEI